MGGMTQAAGETARTIRRWLREEGRFILAAGDFDAAFVGRLRAAGLPVARYTTGVPSLHPQVDSFSTLWEEGKGLTFRQFRLPPASEGRSVNSPIFVAYEEGRTVRCRVGKAPEPGEYDILPDLRAAGMTDYLVLPVPFSDGSHKAVSFATARAGGFTDDEIAVFESVRDDLAAVMEIHYHRHLARTLLDTYVGPVAGQRVLDGAIRRGTGATIRAVVWFCDLRGFTELSERLERDAVIGILNEYFGVMTAAVEEAGGEILKFIGDALLAIFPLSDAEDARTTAQRAVTAARRAEADVAGLNRQYERAGRPAIRYGIALHLGDVMYGNVGGERRLDFTVIGPAVNLASRLESLCGELGETLLASADFVAALGSDGWRSLGEFRLKGLEAAQPAFAPPGGSGDKA